MNSATFALRLLRDRARSGDRPELEQTALRLVLCVIIGLYIPIMKPTPSNESLVVFGGYVMLAAGLFAAARFWPAANVTRRLIGIVADVGITTWVMLRAGEAGSVIFGVYVFLFIGNAFRYGRFYLGVTHALSIVGFTLVLLYSPFWQAHLVIGVGLLIPLVLVPIYLGLLLRRLQAKLLGYEQPDRRPPSEA